MASFGAALGQGIGQAVQGYQQGESYAEQKRLRAQQAQQQAMMNNIKLREMGYDPATGQPTQAKMTEQEYKDAVTQQNLKAIQGKMHQFDQIKAIENFTYSDNFDALEPVARAFGGLTARPLDVNNPKDDELFKQLKLGAGILKDEDYEQLKTLDPQTYFTLKSIEDNAGRFVVVKNQAGDDVLVDLTQHYAQMGGGAAGMEKLNQYYTKRTDTAQKLALKQAEAGLKLQTKQKEAEIAAAGEVGNKLKNAMPYDEWLGTSPSELKNTDPNKYAEVKDLILANAKELGTIPKGSDKKELEDMLSKLDTAERASKITEKSTDIIDSTLSKVGNYVTASKGMKTEKEAKQALEALRNEIRNDFFGSALTEAEIQAFNNSFPTTAQNVTQVWIGLKNAIATLKNKLVAKDALLDPYSAHLYGITEGINGYQALESQLDAKIAKEFGEEEEKTPKVEVPDVLPKGTAYLRTKEGFNYYLLPDGREIREKVAK